MAYYETINLVKGDDLPNLEITLRDSQTAATGKTLDVGDPTTWEVIDLSSVSAVRFKYRRLNHSTLVDTITTTINSPATDGKITLAWSNTTLDDGVGEYEGELELQYANGKFQSVADLLRFDIREGF
jgi:hypothetical protein|tara:strand:- start:1385 stop:1765 length:381 start_codon:yes stop_codon:yes gene_type:complete